MKLADSNGATNHVVPCSNGALRPPHVKRIGPAFALFLKFEDMVTTGAGSDGLVSGGKPVVDADLAKTLGLHPNTVARHRARLCKHGYIALTRTPNGYTVRVRKSKKWALILERRNHAKRPSSDPPELVGHGKTDTPQTVSDPPKMVTDPPGLVDARSSDVAVTIQDVVTTAAAECWRAIGENLPLGTPRFQTTWEFYFTNRNGERLSVAMERAIQRAQRQGVPVPKPFYSAKRRIEDYERDIPPQRALQIHTLTAEEIPA